MAPNMLIPCQKLDPRAKLPSHALATDAGLDLFTLDQACLKPGVVTPVPTGVAMAVPEGYAGLIWDKGGMGLKGIKTLGGVLDHGYTGDVTVLVINLSPETIEIPAGGKIAQILIQKIESGEVTEVDTLPESERGAGRFGSTGG